MRTSLFLNPLAFLVVPVLAGSTPVATQERSPVAPQELLVPSAPIVLPGVKGRIDHLAVDLARERLFVAALGNDSLEVVDLAASRHAQSIGGLGEPQGILYLAARDRIVVACGEDAACAVFDGTTLERVATVKVGADADNLRYDEKSERVFVAFGSGALGVFEVSEWKRLGQAELSGHPESFQLDGAGQRAWVNVPGAHQIALVDLTSLAVRETWPVEEAAANYPLAFLPSDPGAPTSAPDLLLVGCRSPARLVVLSASTGERVQVLELSEDVDDLFYDASRRRVYAICGAGFVDVFERDPQGDFRLLARAPTAPGARTGLFVQERNELFVAAPARGGQPAKILQFRLPASTVNASGD